jgi:hypothetical protein
MDKEKVVHIYNGILFIHKNEMLLSATALRELEIIYF